MVQISGLSKKTNTSFDNRLYSKLFSNIKSSIDYYKTVFGGKFKLKQQLLYKENFKHGHNLILFILLFSLPVALFYCCFCSLFSSYPPVPYLLYNRLQYSFKQKTTTQFIILVDAQELDSIIMNNGRNSNVHLISQPEVEKGNLNFMLSENKNQNTKDKNMKTNILLLKQTTFTNLINDSNINLIPLSTPNNQSKKIVYNSNNTENLLNDMNLHSQKQYEDDVRQTKLANNKSDQISTNLTKDRDNINSTLLANVDQKNSVFKSSLNNNNNLSTTASFELSSTTLASTTNIDDEDIVISSSEILNDYDKLKSIDVIKKLPNDSYKNVSVVNKETMQVSKASSSSDTFNNEDDSAKMIKKSQTTSNSSSTDILSDEQHITNSRLLLRLLVFGLFCLISISLLFLYAIKFCVCRRRKRLLNIQRNLVADLGFNPSSSISSDNTTTRRFHHQCSNEANTSSSTCSAIRRQPLQRERASNSLIDSILGFLLRRFGFFDTSSSRHNHRQRHYQQQLYRRHQLMMSRGDSITSIYQRLTLAERLALHQLANTASSVVGYTDGLNEFADNNSFDCSAANNLNNLNCSLCLASGNSNNNYDHLMSTTNYLVSRPPTYSEIFGLSSSSPAQEQQQQQQVSTETTIQESNTNLPPYERAITSNEHEQQAQQSCETILVNDEVDDYHEDNARLDSHEQFSPSEQQSLAQQQQQKNLLVKLNLNKTKLLSANDLMLLSKIIDVPIVVQQQHQDELSNHIDADRSVTEHEDNTVTNDNKVSVSSNSNTTEFLDNIDKPQETCMASVEDNLTDNNLTSFNGSSSFTSTSSGSRAIVSCSSNGNSSSENSSSSGGKSNTTSLNGRSSKSIPVEHNNSSDNKSGTRRGSSEKELSSSTTTTTRQPKG